MTEEIQEISPSEKIIENALKSETIATDGPMIPKGKEGPKKKGRPRKTETEQPRKSAEKMDAEPQKPKFDIPSQVICYPIVKVISVAGVAVAKDQRAAITSSEADDLSRALGMVMDKWMPDAMAKWGPEVMLGLSLGQYGLRVYALAMSNKERAARTQAQQPQAEARPQTGPVSNITSLSEETVLP